MDDQLLLIICAFGAVAMIGYFFSRLIIGVDDGKLRDRLSAGPYKPGAAGPRQNKQNMKHLLARLGQVAAEPFMPKEREKQSAARRSLARAGIYVPSAVRILK